MKSICFCSLLFLFVGCNIHYYSANMHNTPLLKEKGDLKIDGAVSAGEESNDTFALEFQGAYAINDHWGMVAHFYNIKKKTYGENGITNKGLSSSVGLGYFTPISNTNFLTEIYGSIGVGQAIFKDSEIKYYHDSDQDENTIWVGDYYQKHLFSTMSIQSNLGYKAKYFECALSGKLTRLNYYYRESKIGGYDANYKYDKNFDPFGKSFVLLEPGIMLRGGSKNLKVQSALSIALGAENLVYQSINFSLGLQLSLNAFEKNNSK